MVLIVKRNKTSTNKTTFHKPIVGGAYSEVHVAEKDESKKDKLKNISIIKTGSVKDISPSQEKLNKFINLKLN